MANKKTSKNSGKANKKRLLILTGIVVAVLAILWAGWWLIFKHNAYTPNKETVQQEAKGLYDAMALRGTQVYSSFSDTGCDNSRAVGISTDINCSFVGYRYFETDGPVSENLKAADAAIERAGWERTSRPQSQTAVDDILSDKNNQAVTYLSPKNTPQMVASLGYYKSDSSSSDTYLRRLVEAGTIKSPTDGKYLYGVTITATYWSCNSTTIFKVCPLPPSIPKDFLGPASQ